jgi:tetratricopeptide (TPR) repeat protein
MIMPMNFESDEEMFHFVSDKGISSTHSQGYFWFWRKFMPALDKATTIGEISHELIAGCYYVAGDVHDFNEAPKAAIRCYEQALEFGPEMGAAHREIASMLGRMGKNKKALVHSDKALALNPKDKHALSDRDKYVRETRLSPPLYKKEDRVWAANEHLAKGNPRAAVKVLKRKKGKRAKRAMIHCYGALEKTQDYLGAWRELAASVKELEFTYADWFFMEDGVYSEPELWEILFSSKAEFKGVFTVFDGLDESERYCSLSTHDKIRLRLEYYVYAQSGDFDGLRRLNKLYPEWVELRDTLKD